MQFLVNSDGLSLNYNVPALKNLLDHCISIYYQDREDLLETILFVMNKKNKDYNPIRDAAVGMNIEQHLWNSYKILGNMPKASLSAFNSEARIDFIEHHLLNEEDKLTCLLVALTNRYLDSPKIPRMLNLVEVLPYLDAQQFVGSTNKYGKYATSLKMEENQINLIFNLLPMC